MGGADLPVAIALPPRSAHCAAAPPGCYDRREGGDSPRATRTHLQNPSRSTNRTPSAGVTVGRRRFLQTLGAGTGVALAAADERPRARGSAGRRIRVATGHVFYFAVPAGDRRFSYPHMPSHGVPGCTGWPAPPPDHRGFRVRTGARPRTRIDPIAGSRPSTTTARATSCGATSRTWRPRLSTRRAPATTRPASTTTSSSTPIPTWTTSGWPAAARPRPSSSAPCSATTSPTASSATTVSPTWRPASASRRRSSARGNAPTLDPMPTTRATAPTCSTIGFFEACARLAEPPGACNGHPSGIRAGLQPC